MKFFKLGLSFYLLLVLHTTVLGQRCTLKGKIIENNSSHPLAYATISLFHLKDSTLVTGGITNSDGSFILKKIPIGIYRLKASFIGYQQVFIQPVSLQPGTRDIGTLSLRLLSQNIKAVTVKSTRAAVSYQIDRKVINPGAFPGADVAIDLLENLPSIQVDFNGNLTYRGDGTFKIYINGHPVPNGEEKLRQLSTRKIKQIEVITNPSAKYDAEGTAGIIQVILKKTRLEGYAITSSLKGSTRGEWSYDLSVDHKNKTSGWYIQTFIQKNILRNFDKDDYAEIYSDDGKLFTTNSQTTFKRWKNQSSVEMGLNKDLTTKDYLDISAYFYPLKSRQHTLEEGPVSEITGSVNQPGSTVNYDLHSMDKYNYQAIGATLTYDHAFNKKRSHMLSFYLTYSGYLKDLSEEQKDTRTYSDSTVREGFLYNEQNETTFDGKINYKNPLRNKFSLETGLEINTDHIPTITSVSGTFDENNEMTRFDDEPLNQKVAYLQDIFSVYFTLRKKWKKTGAQVGLRSETTYRESDYSYQNADGSTTREPDHNWFTNLFPSAHLSWNIARKKQLYLSYSRRIRRPNYWALIPVSQYASPYLYYRGNGNLKPSTTHSVELGYKKSVDRNFIALETFTRYTEKVIEIYNQPFSATQLLYSPQNTGNSFSGGAELMLGQDLFAWWNINISTSTYYYKLNINYQNDRQQKKQLKNDSRLNNTFILPAGLTLKWDLRYHSPYRSAQAKREAYWYSDMALKKTSKNKTWDATLAGHNIFSTISYHEITRDDDGAFYMNTRNKQKPFISLKIAYNFDHQK